MSALLPSAWLAAIPRLSMPEGWPSLHEYAKAFELRIAPRSVTTIAEKTWQTLMKYQDAKTRLTGGLSILQHETAELRSKVGSPVIVEAPAGRESGELSADGKHNSGHVPAAHVPARNFRSLCLHQEHLNQHWRIRARDDQRPPPGDWRTWLLMGGRGAGKTRAGAEWVHALASTSREPVRFALVAETLADAREVMIDGISGIWRIAQRKRPDFEISRRRLVWPSGSVAQIFSSEDPDSLRGPQFDYAWK